MKNEISKLSLILMVVPILTTQGAPPANGVSGKTFDFFQKQADAYTKSNTLLWAASHTKTLQTYVAYLERRNYNSNKNINGQTLEETRKALAHFTTSFESWQQDKLNCYLLREVLRQIFDFEKHIQRRARIEEELISRWETIKNETTIAQERAVESLYNEINDQLPQVIEEFLQSLSEAEQKDYRYAFEWYQSKFSVFHSYYQHRLGYDDEPKADDDGCKNFQDKSVVSFLELLMDVWSKRQPKAKPM